MNKRILAPALAAGLLALAGQAQAGAILLTEFDYGPTAYTDMKANLEADGHTVTIVNARTGGNVAAALDSGTYDQVFFWDLTSTAYLNGDDYSALDSFFDAHKNIVLDSRSYGYYFQGNNASEVQLLQNIASEFDSRGGGLWIGTDHDPDWTRNANPLLSMMGFEIITGSYSQDVNDFDPASVLLDGVNVDELWAEGASVGAVPLGIQPNGLDMRFHFGHSSPAYGAIPYISASFGDYVAPDEDPDDHEPPVNVPAPSMLMLGALSLLGLVSSRRRRRS